MLNKQSFFAVVCLVLLSSLGNTHAQDKQSDILQIKLFYEELRFEEAIEFGHMVLDGEGYLSDQHLEYIHQYLAFSFYNIGDTDSARVHFLSLLSIRPDKELDPLKTSPKIIDFFNHTKQNFKEVHTKTNIISYPKYVFVEDKRRDAAWRSALLPGWGQYYKGQTSRAYIFGGIFLPSAVILGVSIINENKNKDSYLNSTDPDDISDNYDKYNSWSKIRRVSTYTTIGIWLLSFADALWTDYPRIELISTRGNNSVLLSVQYLF